MYDNSAYSEEANECMKCNDVGKNEDLCYHCRACGKWLHSDFSGCKVYVQFLFRYLKYIIISYFQVQKLFILVLYFFALSSFQKNKFNLVHYCVLIICVRFFLALITCGILGANIFKKGDFNLIRIYFFLSMLIITDKQITKRLIGVQKSK